MQDQFSGPVYGHSDFLGLLEKKGPDHIEYLTRPVEVEFNTTTGRPDFIIMADYDPAYAEFWRMSSPELRAILLWHFQQRIDE